MYEELYNARAQPSGLLIKPFVQRRFRCRRGFLKLQPEADYSVQYKDHGLVTDAH